MDKKPIKSILPDVNREAFTHTEEGSNIISRNKTKDFAKISVRSPKINKLGLKLAKLKEEDLLMEIERLEKKIEKLEKQITKLKNK